MQQNVKVRRTPAKRKIEAIFKEAKVPLSLKHVYDRTVKILPKTAYSTVYRIILTLEKQKMLTRVNWRDRGVLYEWSGRSHHHHLVCEGCDEVRDLTDQSLSYSEAGIKKSTGYVINNHSIELSGLCRVCQNN